ncbi:MAG: hypothetical protein H7836_00970 [Magnetococcus sp. YQC-3]
MNKRENNRDKSTRDLACAVTGCHGPFEYSRAKILAQQGARELLEAMDKGDLSIPAAAALVELSQEEQRAILAEGKKAVQERVRQMRKMRQKLDISSQVQLIDLPDRMVKRLDSLVGILNDNPSFMPGRPKGITRYAVVREALERGVEELEQLAARSRGKNAEQ